MTLQAKILGQVDDAHPAPPNGLDPVVDDERSAWKLGDRHGIRDAARPSTGERDARGGGTCSSPSVIDCRPYGDPAAPAANCANVSDMIASVSRRVAGLIEASTDASVGPVSWPAGRSGVERSGRQPPRRERHDRRHRLRVGQRLLCGDRTRAGRGGAPVSTSCDSDCGRGQDRRCSGRGRDREPPVRMPRLNCNPRANSHRAPLSSENVLDAHDDGAGPLHDACTDQGPAAPTEARAGRTHGSRRLCP